MSHKQGALIAFAVVAVLSLPLVARDYKTPDDRKLVVSLQQLVRNIMSGVAIEETKAAVDPEAYVVDGKSFESLYDAIRGQSQSCTLIEPADSKLVFQQLVISDDHTAAFMVMKTHSPNLGERFHSVVFFREVRDQWRIKSWHISN